MRTPHPSPRKRRLRATYAALAMASVLGCGSHPPGGQALVLTEPQALDLAVQLANQECHARFKAAPFDASSSPIRYEKGRWWWGGLDLAGPGGMSASVSFDATGGDRRVEAYLSTDQLEGIIGTDSTRTRSPRP